MLPHRAVTVPRARGIITRQVVMPWPRYRLPVVLVAVAVAAPIHASMRAPSSQSVYAPGVVPELLQKPEGYPVRRLNDTQLVAIQPRPEIPRPVSLAGRWETDVDASGIVDGLLLTLSNSVINGIERLDRLTIGVYQREAGEESLGYFIANEGPVTWDGARLRIMSDAGRTRGVESI